MTFQKPETTLSYSTPLDLGGNIIDNKKEPLNQQNSGKFSLCGITKFRCGDKLLEPFERLFQQIWLDRKYPRWLEGHDYPSLIQGRRRNKYQQLLRKSLLPNRVYPTHSSIGQNISKINNWQGINQVSEEDDRARLRNLTIKTLIKTLAANKKLIALVYFKKVYVSIDRNKLI